MTIKIKESPNSFFFHFMWEKQKEKMYNIYFLQYIPQESSLTVNINNMFHLFYFFFD